MSSVMRWRILNHRKEGIWYFDLTWEDLNFDVSKIRSLLTTKKETISPMSDKEGLCCWISSEYQVFAKETEEDVLNITSLWCFFSFRKIRSLVDTSPFVTNISLPSKIILFDSCCLLSRGKGSLRHDHFLQFLSLRMLSYLESSLISWKWRQKDWHWEIEWNRLIWRRISWRRMFPIFFVSRRCLCKVSMMMMTIHGSRDSSCSSEFTSNVITDDLSLSSLESISQGSQWRKRKIGCEGKHEVKKDSFWVRERRRWRRTCSQQTLLKVRCFRFIMFGHFLVCLFLLLSCHAIYGINAFSTSKGCGIHTHR
jgi:hypothetical protein